MTREEAIEAVEVRLPGAIDGDARRVWAANIVDVLLDGDVGDMTRVGDRLQSEASRLAEWTHKLPWGDLPVAQAVLGVESAVDEWTEIRRKQ